MKRVGSMTSVTKDKDSKKETEENERDHEQDSVESNTVVSY